MELLSNSINSSFQSLDIGENDLGWPNPLGGETEWQHERDLKCSWDLDRNGSGNGDNPGMNGNKFQLGHGLHGPSRNVGSKHTEWKCGFHKPWPDGKRQSWGSQVDTILHNYQRLFVRTVYLVLSKSLWQKIQRHSRLGVKPRTSYILVQTS